jgi:antitoxin FitA
VILAGSTQIDSLILPAASGIWVQRAPSGASLATEYRSDVASGVCVCDLVFGRAQDWLAPRCCNYNGCMSVSLTIRDLPEATRDMLRQRAEASRQSLNSYIVDLLEREAGLPTMREWADMVESRARLTGSSDAAVEAVRELRDAE